MHYKRINLQKIEVLGQNRPKNPKIQ
jgi:hypothetical protein